MNDNATGTRRRAPLLAPSPPSAISNRKSGIRNPNNRRVFNPFHFSNRKYSQLFPANLVVSLRNVAQPLLFPARHSSPVTHHRLSNRDTAIKNPNNPHHFNHFQFSNRDKVRVLHPEINGSALSALARPSLVTHHLSLASPLCLRASVANLCDNVRLQLRRM